MYDAIKAKVIVYTMVKPYDRLFADLFANEASLHGMPVVWNFGDPLSCAQTKCCNSL